MKKICKNCKFWEKGTWDDNDQVSDAYGSCSSAKCREIPPDEYDLETDILFLEHDQNYDVGMRLHTGENFGCIHFEEMIK